MGHIGEAFLKIKTPHITQANIGYMFSNEKNAGGHVWKMELLEAPEQQ